MDTTEWVDGDGWISDDSDFYGSAATKEKFEKLATRELKVPYIVFPWIYHPTSSAPDPAPSRSKRTKNDDRPKKGGMSSSDALDFLKSRPQIAARQTAAAASSSKSSLLVRKDELVEMEPEDNLHGLPSAKQPHETVVEFLRRAPVGDPATADLGHWLWVGSTKFIYAWRQREAKTDVESMREGGYALLKAHDEQREKMKQANPQATDATISRKLGPYRETLEDDLLTLAVKTHTTSGKWMLFPSVEDYPRIWRVVAEATDAGKLGPVSKAATYNMIEPLNLICVYTYDFSDEDDVRRILKELVDLGLCIPDGKALFYKCDAYTHLDLKSNNEYKLRASLYSSKQVLGLEAKQKKEGPIERLRKRNTTVETYFAS